MGRVLDLVDAGRSLRATALDVFGSRTLHGRVVRLLRSTRRKTADELDADREVADALAGLDRDEGALAALVGLGDEAA